MDVILDVLDTFVFDRFYAWVIPGDIGALINASPLLNQHVSAYYPLQPSKWAERSHWKRDNILRQSLTLFLVSW